MKESCPHCHSSRLVKNGTAKNLHQTKQTYLCRDCGRQHRQGQRRHKLEQATIDLLKRLLAERVSLRAAARILGLADSTVKRYSKKLQGQTDTTQVQTQGVETDCRSNVCEIVLDEAWSFTGDKKHKQWIWIALDALSLQVLAMVIGSRGKRSLQKLLQRLPYSWLRYGKFYSDGLAAYEKVLPPERHTVKDESMQNLAENFFMRLRARSSRLVRKTVSFSKKLANHVAAIFYSVNELNKSLY